MFLGVLASLQTDCNRCFHLNARNNCTDKSVLIKFYTGELYYNLSNPFSFSFPSRSYNDRFARRLIRVSAKNIFREEKIFWTKVKSERMIRTNGFLWPIHVFALSLKVLEIIQQKWTNAPELLGCAYVYGFPNTCEEYRSLVFIYSSHGLSWDGFVVRNGTHGLQLKGEQQIRRAGIVTEYLLFTSSNT